MERVVGHDWLSALRAAVRARSVVKAAGTRPSSAEGTLSRHDFGRRSCLELTGGTVYRERVEQAALAHQDS
ncbi:hypothetical protein [Dactylosporangium salmoneum]|uniref:hypothetical protein n=1 Tax=Dactylosporangium salmoneum TaxID=53361 RepID=UPI0031D59E4B